MKTIKAIRKSKDVEIGDIKRVDDKTANNMVGSMWAYISKTEWKQATRKPKDEASTKQTEKKINPKQDLPDDGKEFVKTRKKSKQ
jgi:hypothetical protein